MRKQRFEVLELMLTLPAADEYQRALLHPALAFQDAELAAGKPRLSPFGLPVAWSGQFATVFQVETPGGRRAVRCFTTSLSDQQQRYAALQDHLRRHPLPQLASAGFLAEGMLVKGARLPIVKMEWIEGKPLDRAVEEAVQARDAATLRALADALPPLAAALEQAQIAHGDLQHENILVAAGGLRLVDFDGVWLAPLARLGALETGHPHYQHPRRDRSDYGAHIDRFPALVLALSLRALAAEPGLWQRYHSDKHLIFRRDDFLAAESSPLVLDLTRSPDATVRRLTLALVQAAAAPSTMTPPLCDLLEPAPAPKTRTRAPSSPKPASSPVHQSTSPSVHRSASSPVHQSTSPPVHQSTNSPLAAAWQRLDRATARLPYSDVLGDGVLRVWGWLRAAPPAPPLSGGVAAGVVLALGVGGGILAAWLRVAGAGALAPSAIAALLGAGVLPLVFVVTRLWRAAAAAQGALLITAAALAGVLSLPLLGVALISAAAALIFVRLRLREITLKRLLAASALAALPPALLLLPPLAARAGLEASTPAALLALAASIPAAPLAMAAGRSGRAALVLLVSGRRERV